MCRFDARIDLDGISNQDRRGFLEETANQPPLGATKALIDRLRRARGDGLILRRRPAVAQTERGNASIFRETLSQSKNK
jgi:hypothetical protein